VIDSVALTWGHSIGTAERRARVLAEPLSPPVRLDLEKLNEKLGAGEGKVTTKDFGDGEPTAYGHWQSGPVEVLYREGRLELRASLPKLLIGRNDVVLDEGGVHDALHELVRVGRELVDGTGAKDHPSTPRLTLREADPSRLDYCFQWQVPSVAFTLEHINSGYHPARKTVQLTTSPAGGRTLMYRGGKRVIRFYDKVGEMLAKKDDEIPPDAEVDTLLRYEVQDRRRSHLRLVHENGYRASDVRGELARTIEQLGAMSLYDLDAIRESYGKFIYAVPFTLAALYVAEHDEIYPWLKKNVGKGTYSRWKARARAARLTYGGVDLTIPSNAFESESSLWSMQEATAA